MELLGLDTEKRTPYMCVELSEQHSLHWRLKTSLNFCGNTNEDGYEERHQSCIKDLVDRFETSLLLSLICANARFPLSLSHSPTLKPSAALAPGSFNPTASPSTKTTHLRSTLNSTSLKARVAPVMMLSRLAFATALPALAKRAPIMPIRNAPNANIIKARTAPTMPLSLPVCPKALSTIEKRAPVSSIGAISRLRPTILNAQTPISKRHVGTEASTSAKRTLSFKVERKFLPTDASIAALRANSGTPRLKGLQYIASEEFEERYDEVGYHEHDEYTHDLFDRDHLACMEKGCYVIWGIGDMHAKIRQFGNNVNGGYEEIYNQDEVLDYLSKTVGCTVGLRDLQEIVDMKTKREQWRVGDYTVVIDKTDIMELWWQDEEYDYATGSVTWCQEIEEGQEGTVWKRENRRMKRFMKKHRWAFGETMEESKDKVTACIDERRDHEEMIAEAMSGGPNW
jgi:hypothetical protein